MSDKEWAYELQLAVVGPAPRVEKLMHIFANCLWLRQHSFPFKPIVALFRTGPESLLAHSCVFHRPVLLDQTQGARELLHLKRPHLSMPIQ